MLERIIRIVNTVANTIIVIGIIVIGILLLTGYVINNCFDDDNFYAFITAIVTFKLLDKLGTNTKKIGKAMTSKKRV